MKVETRLSGLDGVLDLLNKLPPEVVSKRGGPVRRALRKGALRILEQAQTNIRASIAQAGKTGITDTTGLTAQSVVARRRRLDRIKGERYVVTVAGKPHPGGGRYRRRPIRTNDIAFFLEYGTSKQPATPWLRPAFASRAQDAVQTVETELVRDLERIVAKLARQNRSAP